MNQLFLFNTASIFKVTGDSAERYLQGRCTQNISSMSSGDSCFALILTPQGRVEGMFNLYKQEKNIFYLIVPSFLGQEDKESFIKSFLKYKVADQVFLEDLSENLRLVLASSEEGASCFSEEIKKSYDIIASPVVDFKTLNLTTKFHYFIFSKKSNEIFFDQDSESLREKFSFASSDRFDYFRINAGLPVFNKDVTTSTIATDLPLDSFVSKNKGCYAGQEVVEMATARGKPNKRFVLLSSNQKIEGSNVFNKDQLVGSMTSIASDSDRYVALGYVKNKEYDGGFSSGVLNEDNTVSSLRDVDLKFLS